MTRKRVLTLFLALTLCFATLGLMSVQAADAPAYTAYNIPSYEAVAVASNRTDSDLKRFIQGCDWGSMYGVNDYTNPNSQLFWVLSKDEYNAAGDTKPTFTIPLNVAAAGKYQVALKVFIGGDFGKFKVTLGDKVLTESIDCFGDGGLSFINLGEHDLAAGDQNLVFTCLGWADGNTSGACNLGVSRLVLSPSGYYWMPNYLNEAAPSNRTAEFPRRFVQNMNREWKAAFSAHDVIAEDNGQLFWELPKGEAANATFTIPLTVGAAGKYDVSAVRFKGGDFGQFEVSLGGHVVGNVDCHGEGGQTEIALGQVELSAGVQNLVFKYVGCNEGNTTNNVHLGITSLTLTAVAAEEPPVEDEVNPDTSDLAVATSVLAVVCLGGIALLGKKRRH